MWAFVEINLVSENELLGKGKNVTIVNKREINLLINKNEKVTTTLRLKRRKMVKKFSKEKRECFKENNLRKEIFWWNPPKLNLLGRKIQNIYIRSESFVSSFFNKKSFKRNWIYHRKADLPTYLPNDQSIGVLLSKIIFHR